MKLIMSIFLSLFMGICLGAQQANQPQAKDTVIKQEAVSIKKAPCILKRLAGEQPNDVCMVRDFLAKLPPYIPRKTLVPYRNTYLYHGKSGTGKTTGTESMVEEAKAIFIMYQIEDLVRKNPQDLADAVKKIYNDAQETIKKEKRPVVIFFDDLKEYHRNILDFINKYLTAYSGNPYIITIVATNREMSNFNEEFKSRCTSVLWEMPDEKKRYAIIKRYFFQCHVSYEDEFAQAIAKKADGFTGRMIEEAIQRSYAIARDEGVITVSMKHVSRAFSEQQKRVDQTRSTISIFWLWLQGKRF